jgi:hypothetical protein
MKRGLIFLAILLAVLPSSPFVIRAQQKIPPLILVISGDLWKWDASGQTLKQLTQWGYNSAPVVSPDGKYVAYNSLPAFVVDDIKKQGGRSGYPPSNIWLMEIATGNAVRIADQPPDARFAGNGKDEKFTLRASPSWSPDSKALAWGEIVGNKTTSDGSFAGYEQHLVVYDIARKRQTVILKDMPAYNGITGGDAVYWGESGIAVLINPGAGEPTDPSTPTLFLYDSAGKLLLRQPLDTVDTKDRWYDFAWAKDGPKEFGLIYTEDQSSGSLLFDPQTGQVTTLSGRIEHASATALDGIHLTYDDGLNILPPGKDPVHIADSTVAAISPDGQQVAYITGEDDEAKGWIYHDGQTMPLSLKPGQKLTDLAWGPMTVVRPKA